MIKSLPLFLKGTVCKGYGRGSKELGIPTANFAEEIIELLPNDLLCGIYYGWAQVNASPVYKMVMSIGWNPFYQNVKRSAETHILHQFENDFYGSELKVIIVGYTRPERDFSSVDELVAEIENDIKISKEKLDEKSSLQYKTHSFFSYGPTDLIQQERGSLCLTEDKVEESVNSLSARI